MHFTALPSDQVEQCASVSCGHAPASWRMDAGDVGSYFCETCKAKLVFMGTEQVRVIFTDGLEHVRRVAFPDAAGKVFAVVGPFDGMMDKMELQNRIVALLKEWNGTN